MCQRSCPAAPYRNVDLGRRTEWETALHHTARVGDLALARRLVALGADGDRRDKRFGSTALGWARYFEQPELIAFLDPRTSPEDDAGQRTEAQSGAERR